VPQILPAPPVCKVLLGFDFDDTLVFKNAPREINRELFTSLERLRESEGAVWGIATGRSLPQLMEGFNAVGFPFLPDFVVAREREISFPGSFGRFQPHQEWNKRCDKDHAKVFRKSKRVFAKVRRFIEKETKAEWVSVEGDAAGVVASSSEEMDLILAFFEGLPSHENLSYERNSIYLRFSHNDYSKGAGLLETARSFGLGSESILAVGDNLNDMSMLQSHVSGMCGCPSNSLAEVCEFVRSRGGFVAEGRASDGAVEILNHYFPL